LDKAQRIPLIFLYTFCSTFSPHRFVKRMEIWFRHFHSSFFLSFLLEVINTNEIRRAAILMICWTPNHGKQDVNFRIPSQDFNIYCTKTSERFIYSTRINIIKKKGRFKYIHTYKVLHNCPLHTAFLKNK